MQFFWAQLCAEQNCAEVIMYRWWWRWYKVYSVISHALQKVTALSCILVLLWWYCSTSSYPFSLGNTWNQNIIIFWDQEIRNIKKQWDNKILTYSRSGLDSIAASLFVMNWLSWQIVRRLRQPLWEGVQNLWGASAPWKLEVADVFWWISPPVHM